MPQTCGSCEDFISTTHVLTNPFPHNQHMASSSSNAKNVASGSQNPPTQDGDHLCINMVKYEVNVATRSHDYSSPQTVPGLESPPPPETPLQIEKPEPPPHIPKGVLKRSTHNPNARATHNYSIVEDLGQTPCAMSGSGGTPDMSFTEECLAICVRSSRSLWLKSYQV
jgi:hypothetical protein